MCMCGFRVLSTWVKQVYVGFQGVIYMGKQVYVWFQGVIYMGKTGVCVVVGCYLHG